MLAINIKKSLPDFRLEVAFKLEREIMAILGPSGCGKTMTLKCIAGLVEPGEGEIILDDTQWFNAVRRINLPPQKRRVGFVFQNYALFPHLTVYHNVAFGLRGRPAKEIKARVNQILNKMGILKLEGRLPSQLSGGQQQRVALARALASEPEVLLLDEPFSALDSMVKRRLEDELLRIQDYYNGHVLYVTHNLEEAYRLSTKMAVYEAGKVLQQGDRQEITLRPANRRVALLTGTRNILSGVVLGVKGSRVEVAVEELGGSLQVECVITKRLSPHQQVSVGIRAEHIQLSREPGENIFPVVVKEHIEEVSAHTYRFKRQPGTEGTLLEARSIMNETILHPGDNCYINLPPSRLFVMED